MPFEEIQGMKNREFKNEAQLNFVLAIKECNEETLYEAFQNYWKKRCNNNSYLSDYDAWKIISRYAREIFDQEDRYVIEEALNRNFFWKMSISAREMSEIYLTAFELMRMRD